MEILHISDEERRRIQQLELDILMEVDRICRKNGIQYTMGYGSLIGAIRHNGFIPWDDDIDICMLRKDYIRFKDVCKTELDNRFFYQSQDTDPEYYYLFDKIRLNGTVFKESFVSKWNIHHGIYIDVFPVDYIPDNWFKRKIQYYTFHFFRTGVQSKYIMLQARKGIRRYMFSVAKLLYSFFPLSFLYKNANRIAMLYDQVPQKKIMNMYTPYRMKEVFDIQMYQNFIEHEFENKKVQIVKDYDIFLRQIYGDYMQLPPMEQRNTRHTIIELKL